MPATSIPLWIGSWGSPAGLRRRVHFWPIGDERRQIELLATEVLPRIAA